MPCLCIQNNALAMATRTKKLRKAATVQSGTAGNK